MYYHNNKYIAGLLWRDSTTFFVSPLGRSPHQVRGDDGGAPGHAVVAVHKDGAAAARWPSPVLQAGPDFE